MKKVFLFITLIIIFLAFVACDSSKDNSTDSTGTQAASSNQGIIINTIGFKRIRLEDLSDDIRSKVDEFREEQGYEVINSGEDMYLVVYAGERRTSGYEIEIQSIVDNEGQTEIKVIETVPQEEAMVLQVLTYPLDIVKLESGISGNVTLAFDKTES